MEKILVNYTNKWIIYSLGFFLIIVTNIGCSTQKVTSSNTQYNTSCSLSRYEGQTNKFFSSKIIVKSNFITNLQIIKVEGLPKGVVLNKSRGIIEGTPEKAGFYSISVEYNDLYKGSHRYPNGSWTKDFEIRIYDKLN